MLKYLFLYYPQIECAPSAKSLAPRWPLSEMGLEPKPVLI